MNIKISDKHAFEDIILTREGTTAVLTWNRPAKLNAITHEMHLALANAIRLVASDEAFKVLVLTGTGRAFCAGDDMGESDPRTGSLPLESEVELEWHNAVRAMRAMRKPVIGAANGLACGAGGGILLGADIRFASEAASFADIFTKRGIAGGAYLLTQIVGTAKALELMYTGDFIDAHEGLRLGLFNKVVPADQLMPVTLEFAERLARGPAEALGYSKWAAYQSAHLFLNEGLRVEELSKVATLRSAAVREGIVAFNDKRQAAFGATQ